MFYQRIISNPQTAKERSEDKKVMTMAAKEKAAKEKFLIEEDKIAKALRAKEIASAIKIQCMWRGLSFAAFSHMMAHMCMTGISYSCYMRCHVQLD
jgi:hypothetical protein